LVYEKEDENMPIEIKKTVAQINRRIAGCQPQVLVECDVIVPDAKPDVLKVIQVDATAVIVQKDVQQGRVVINGRIDFKILYVPESAKGLKGITYSTAFTHVEEVKEATPSIDASITADVEHIEFSMLNSRKIGIKGVVGMEMELSDKLNVETVSDIEGDNVQSKGISINAFNTIVDKEVEVLLTEQLVVPSGKPPIGAILKTDVAIRNRDVKVISNKIVVKGEIAICTLYTPEGEDGVTYMEHEMPFTEILDAEGISDELYSEISFDVKGSYFREVPDSDGDMRAVNAEVRLGVAIKAGEMVSINSLADAYGTDTDLGITREKLEIQEIVDTLKLQFTCKEALSTPSDIPNIVQVYNVIAKPYITSETVSGGKVNVAGVIDAYVLYLSDREDSPVYSFMQELPFAQSVDCNMADDDSLVNAHAEVSHISYSLNAAGGVDVRVIASCNVKVTRVVEAEVVVDVTENPLTCGKIPSIVIYFVQSGDSMWEIAKRYRTRVADIEAVNSLSSEYRLETGMQLLIPRK